MILRTSRPARRSSFGVTLIEAALCIVVISILVGLAVPSFLGAIQRHQVDGAMRQFKADLRYGYFEAIARGQTVQITFSQTPAGSCYVIASPEPCPCDTAGQAACSLRSQPLRTALLPTSSGITLQSNVRQMTFDGRRNTISPAASIDIRSKGPGGLRAIVNIVGRTRVCSASEALNGYTPC